MRRRALMSLPLGLLGAGAALAQSPPADRRAPEHRRDPLDPHVPYGRDGREPHFDRGDRDGRDNRDYRDGRRGDWDRDGRRDWDRDDRDARERVWRREARRSRYYREQNPPRYARGAGPYRNYHPGGRLPDEYRLRHYVVNDWRGYGLSAPPRGTHWIQTGSDFVLVAIATGIILQLLLRD